MSRPDVAAPGPASVLKRELGVFGAVMMGLGSIIGTGIFVSIGIAVGVAGPAVIIAIAIAALVAICNALSSAQLAASHPTSGGTYEYGYVYLHPVLGFSAGWMFLCAKSASAATAALGFAGYTLAAFGTDGARWHVPLALAAVAVIVVVVLSGLRRSNLANVVIITVTLLTLGFFILAGMSPALEHGRENLRDFFSSPLGDTRPTIARLLEAAALMFVAYTGYGRIATMGEEVRSPRETIPQAIVITLVVTMALYLAVALVGICAAGAAGFTSDVAQRGALLAVVADSFGVPSARLILSVGAVTAMLGVLLNLVLGLSRVALAMGRRGDLPVAVGRVNASGTTPTWAVVLVGLIILGLTAIGSIRLAWSFSALTVLLYYAITNLAAIRLPREQRLYHPVIAWIGLAGCLSLAFWVEPVMWIAGVGVLAVGFVLRAILRRGG